MYLGSKLYVEVADISTAILREAWATLSESSSQPLLATLAQSRNLAHASLETAVSKYTTWEKFSSILNVFMLLCALGMFINLVSCSNNAEKQLAYYK